jgi:hypothetical protein
MAQRTKRNISFLLSFAATRECVLLLQNLQVHAPEILIIAGSDVAGLQTTAKKSPDGKYYIVNGQKKWITNGIWADYCTAAVRTGGPGANGISALIIPLKNHPGVTTRKQFNSGVNASGTLLLALGRRPS